MHMKQGRYRGVRVVVDLSGLGDSLQGGVFQAALDLLCSLHRKIASVLFKQILAVDLQYSGQDLAYHPPSQGPKDCLHSVMSVSRSLICNDDCTHLDSVAPLWYGMMGVILCI